MKKLFNTLVVIYPILSAYSAFAGLDFGVVLVFLVGVACSVINIHSLTTHLPKGYWPYFVLLLLSSLLVAHKLPLWPIMYTVCFIFAISFCNINKLIKYYTVSVYICSAFFLLQWGLATFVGLHISGFIPGLSLIYGDDGGLGYIDNTLMQERVSGFFLEPSYLAQYIFPFVAIKLFSGSKRDFREAILFTFILILVRSGNGVFVLAIIWGIWFWHSDFANGRKVIYTVLLVLMMGVFSFVAPQLVESLLSRADELNFTKVEAYDWYHSGFIRFYRGYYLYADIPLMNKLFGSPMDLIEQVRAVNPYYYFDKNTTFLNGIQMLLIYYGIFVCLMYLRHLYFYAKGSKDNLIISLVACVFFLMFSESYYMTSRMFLLTTMLYLYRKITITHENTIYNQQLS